MDRLLKVSEVAQILGVSRSQVYEMLSQGELPGVRIGTSVRVPVGRLQLWIRNRVDGGSPSGGVPGRALEQQEGPS